MPYLTIIHRLPRTTQYRLPRGRRHVAFLAPDGCVIASLTGSRREIGRAFRFIHRNGFHSFLRNYPNLTF